MTPRDFILLFLACLFWGLNLVITRWVVTEAAPPLFYATMRFGLIALTLMWLLRPIPKQFTTLVLIAMCIGGGNFALLFIGLQNAPASAAAVAGQLGLPFTTLLSMAFLGERVRWRRGLGMCLAFAGVVMIAFDPQEFGFSFGLLLVIGAAFIGSIGGVLMKKFEPIPALAMQAWVGLLSVGPLGALTAIFEPTAVSEVAWGDWRLWAATAFSVALVSLFGHGVYYMLVKRYEVTLLTPLTLMTPIWGVVFGIVLLGEPATVKLAIGGAVALLGVLIIAVRPNASLPRLAFWSGMK